MVGQLSDLQDYLPRDRHERLRSSAALASASGYRLSIKLLTRPCASSAAICSKSSPFARTSTRCALGLRPSVARRTTPMTNEASIERSASRVASLPWLNQGHGVPSVSLNQAAFTFPGSAIPFLVFIW